jgi:hypothetical protein
MKESEFIELLNLYLDHEISAADAARLEAEVQADPARRRVYREYCQMQKACTVLAKDFAEQPAVDRKVIAFEPRRASWSPSWFAGGGLAIAAACVALVVVNRTPQAAPSAPQAVAQTMGAVPATSIVAPTAGKLPATAAPSVPVAIEPATQIARSTTAPATVAESRLVLASSPVPLASANPIDVGALLASAQQNAQAQQQTVQAQLAWMHSVQLAPIQQTPLSDPRLDARSPLQTYTKPRQPQANVEMTAFKFQR